MSSPVMSPRLKVLDGSRIAVVVVCILLALVLGSAPAVYAGGPLPDDLTSEPEDRPSKDPSGTTSPSQEAEMESSSSASVTPTSEEELVEPAPTEPAPTPIASVPTNPVSSRSGPNLVAVLAILIAVLIVAAFGLLAWRRLSHRGRIESANPTGAAGYGDSSGEKPAESRSSNKDPSALDWTDLSGDDQEAFRRTAEEFGWK